MSAKSRWNKNIATCLLGVLLAGWGTGTVQATVFKWKDDQGKVHYTDSLSKVPQKFRNRNNSSLKTLKSAPTNTFLNRGSSEKISGFSLSIPTRGIEVPLILLGSGNYAVEVVLNNSTKLVLMLDTGASSVVLHPSLAKKVGIRNLEGQPQVTVSTAGGQELNPVGVLNSVKVGKAIVTDVEAVFNSHMDPKGGLLGMTFLDNFRFELDRQRNFLILKPLNSGKDKVYGGRPESWWKDKYTSYFSGLNRASYLKSKAKVKKDKLEFQKFAHYYQDLIDRLDQKAEQAGLPEKYRDPFGNRSKKENN